MCASWADRRSNVLIAAVCLPAAAAALQVCLEELAQSEVMLSDKDAEMEVRPCVCGV